MPTRQQCRDLLVALMKRFATGTTPREHAWRRLKDEMGPRTRTVPPTQVAAAPSYEASPAEGPTTNVWYERLIARNALEAAEPKSRSEF